MGVEAMSVIDQGGREKVYEGEVLIWVCQRNR